MLHSCRPARVYACKRGPIQGVAVGRFEAVHWQPCQHGSGNGCAGGGTGSARADARAEHPGWRGLGGHFALCSRSACASTAFGELSASIPRGGPFSELCFACVLVTGGSGAASWGHRGRCRNQRGETEKPSSFRVPFGERVGPTAEG